MEQTKNDFAGIINDYAPDIYHHSLINNLPANALLCRFEEIREYQKSGIIPYAYHQDKLLLLIRNEHISHLQEIEKHFRRKCAFIIQDSKGFAGILQKIFAQENVSYAVNYLHDNMPKFSAKKTDYLPILVIFALITLTAIISQNFLILFFHGLYFLNSLFKLVLILANKPAKDEVITLINDEDLPIYSILLPMYKEARTLPHLIEALEKLDYPKDKLDIKLILEQDDVETLREAERLALPSHYEILIVPDMQPRTKPKACNYALAFVRGSLLTIYDAEDRPDPQQLRKSTQLFMNNNSLACVQARLNYYNAKENLLTRFFRCEYGLWFHYFLSGLARLGLPLPLGGTSNHIRTDALMEIGGWDPFNVTEDADLGLRISRYGYAVNVVDSETLEEAPLGVMAWLNQRTRWIRGYMQTYLVHMRLLRGMKTREFIGLQLFIGLPALIFLAAPIMWAVGMAAGGDYLSLMIFNFLFAGVIHIAAAIRLGYLDYSLILLPFYWLLHSFAAFRAFYRLLFNPHIWEKTQHGVSSLNN